jgi:glucose-6-phosphate dehydrogenase assembly protein OpcA
MNDKKLEEMASKLSDLYDMVNIQRRAVGFLADRIEDDQASASLQLIEYGMERIENTLNIICGRSPEHIHDVPY